VNLTNTADLTEHTPTWDPTGTRIAFSGRSGQIWVLYLGLDEYGDLTVVDEWHVTETTGPPLSTGSKGHPSWSSDDTEIVFEQEFRAGKQARGIYARVQDKPAGSRGIALVTLPAPRE